MSAMEQAFEKAKTQGARVVFPEADDPRIAEAMARLRAEGVCDPVVPGDVSAAQVAALVTARGMKEALARRMLSRPLYRAAAMVAAGEADAMVAGAVTSTKKVIEAASIAIGLADGATFPSSFFLMRFPDGRELIFADCGLSIDPTAGELAEIARMSARSGAALLDTARVALLSYSTGTSGSGRSVETVREAAAETGYLGPLQGDAALNPSVAAKKGLGAGDANVLIFPDLNSGNIAYKLAQELAGAQALGPILQGFRKPVCDLSRGASVDDIVNATVVSLALG